MGDVKTRLQNAQRLINQHAGPVMRCSHRYKSRAWGFDAEEEFSNQVLEVDTDLMPEQLLDALQIKCSCKPYCLWKYSCSSGSCHTMKSFTPPVICRNMQSFNSRCIISELRCHFFYCHLINQMNRSFFCFFSVHCKILILSTVVPSFVNFCFYLTKLLLQQPHISCDIVYKYCESYTQKLSIYQFVFYNGKRR